MKLSYSRILKAIQLAICLEVQRLDTLFKSVSSICLQLGLLSENNGLAHQDRSFNACFLVRYLTHGTGNPAHALCYIKILVVLV